MMTRLLTLLLVLLAGAAALPAGTYTVDEVPDVHRADRTRFVADPDGYVDAASRAAIDATLADIRSRTTAEPMVAVVGSIPSDTDIDTYATELFERWGLGKQDRDNGLLIVVAVDDRRMAIRPGYGLEGVLPDIVCGRIIRETLAPAFRRGDYGAGLAEATSQIARILTDPAYAEEIRSAERDTDTAGGAEGAADGFLVYVYCACGLAAIMLLMLALSLAGVRGRSDYDKYRALAPGKSVWLILTFLGLGIPCVATIPYLLFLRHWRDHRRKCPTCGTTMQKIDEVHDNDYLTPAQDLEERIGSVDYDVWRCPSCGETDILPYVSSKSQYIECDRCHARTARLVANRVLRHPGPGTKGIGVREYECLNCHHRQQRGYDIEPEGDGAALAALGLGAALGSRGGGSFGGGSFGGGFGGGSTGGGGASGGW